MLDKLDQAMIASEGVGGRGHPRARFSVWPTTNSMGNNSGFWRNILALCKCQDDKHVVGCVRPYIGHHYPQIAPGVDRAVVVEGGRYAAVQIVDAPIRLKGAFFENARLGRPARLSVHQAGVVGGPLAVLELIMAWAHESFVSHHSVCGLLFDHKPLVPLAKTIGRPVRESRPLPPGRHPHLSTLKAVETGSEGAVMDPRELLDEYARPTGYLHGQWVQVEDHFVCMAWPDPEADDGLAESYAMALGWPAGVGLRLEATAETILPTLPLADPAAIGEQRECVAELLSQAVHALLVRSESSDFQLGACFAATPAMRGHPLQRSRLLFVESPLRDPSSGEMALRRVAVADPIKNLPVHPSLPPFMRMGIDPDPILLGEADVRLMRLAERFLNLDMGVSVASTDGDIVVVLLLVWPRLLAAARKRQETDQHLAEMGNATAVRPPTPLYLDMRARAVPRGRVPPPKVLDAWGVCRALLARALPPKTDEDLARAGGDLESMQLQHREALNEPSGEKKRKPTKTQVQLQRRLGMWRACPLVPRAADLVDTYDAASDTDDDYEAHLEHERKRYKLGGSKVAHFERAWAEASVPALGRPWCDEFRDALVDALIRQRGLLAALEVQMTRLCAGKLRGQRARTELDRRRRIQIALDNVRLVARRYPESVPDLWAELRRTLLLLSESGETLPAELARRVGIVGNTGAAISEWEPVRAPLQTLGALMLLSGSDYVESPPGVGEVKLVNAFFENPPREMVWYRKNAGRGGSLDICVDEDEVVGLLVRASKGGDEAEHRARARRLAWAVRYYTLPFDSAGGDRLAKALDGLDCMATDSTGASLYGWSIRDGKPTLTSNLAPKPADMEWQ